MRSLQLTKLVPSHTRDTESSKLLNSHLPVSKAFTLFALVVFGKNNVVEKHRDAQHRMLLFHSMSPFCLSKESKQLIMDSDECYHYLVGLAKIAQQTISYNLHGTAINHICEKVLTPRDIHPSDDVKTHLGLTGEHAKKSFMDL